MKKIALLIGILITFSNCESFFVEDISDEEIVVLGPLNAVELSPGTIRFNWKEISGADAYEIEIVAPSFLAPTQIVVSREINTTVFEVALEAGDYEWRVRGINTEHATPYKTNRLKIN
ncbi:hypothetical protein [Tenacibaculum amylolyticum]|uniref:hypothetical protein n=1 Tax=Tenacibaculum amylolyticum TaxID=104269 RepID=UPI003895EE51